MAKRMRYLVAMANAGLQRLCSGLATSEGSGKYTQEKDGSHLGCVSALQAGHQEHTCNSTSWDSYWLQLKRPHTWGMHPETQRVLERTPYRTGAFVGDSGGRFKEAGFCCGLDAVWKLLNNSHLEGEAVMGSGSSVPARVAEEVHP